VLPVRSYGQIVDGHRLLDHILERRLIVSAAGICEEELRCRRRDVFELGSNIRAVSRLLVVPIPVRNLGTRDGLTGPDRRNLGLAGGSRTLVEFHDVSLPSRFVDHITSGVRPAAHLRSPDDAVEFGYGETWCRHNLSLDYFKRLGLARQQTNLLTEQLLEEQFHDVEQRTGVSTESCIWAGCPNRALLGIKFCSRCAAKMQPHHPSAAHGIGLRRFLDDYGQN
jgi:hypothetical protein